MFVMSYLIATKWGSMQEKSRTFSAQSVWEARREADRFLASLKAKGLAVYPQYDLVKEAA